MHKFDDIDPNQSYNRLETKNTNMVSRWSIQSNKNFQLGLPRHFFPTFTNATSDFFNLVIEVNQVLQVATSAKLHIHH